MTRLYRLGRRGEAADETRARVVAAAQALLSAPEGAPAFTVDAVARAAGVSRMTVFNKFRSKQGLLEALFDSLAASGGMRGMREAFERDDPLDMLDAFTTVLARFWAAHRLVHRRLRALVATDPELEPAWRQRHQRRHEGAAVILARLAARYGRPADAEREEAMRLFLALTSFEFYDQIAGDGADPGAVEVALRRLVRCALRCDAP
jgi:AcrR family transcriptional regulator